MLRFWFSWVVCGLAAAVLAGCGGGELDVVPATGTVTLDGQPVEGATVTFVPQDADGRTATGTTDQSGKFVLQTAGAGEGALPGKYKVTVSKVAVGAAAGTEATTEEQGMQQVMQQMQGARDPAAQLSKPLQEQDQLPARYKSADTSGLEAEVKAGEDNNFTFDLKTSG